MENEHYTCRVHKLTVNNRGLNSMRLLTEELRIDKLIGYKSRVNGAGLRPGSHLFYSFLSAPPFCTKELPSAPGTSFPPARHKCEVDLLGLFMGLY